MLFEFMSNWFLCFDSYLFVLQAMEPPILVLIDSIEHCLSPKLTKGFYESENHIEFANQSQRMDRYFPALLKSLEVTDLRKNERYSSSALSSLWILYKELKSQGPWNSDKPKEYWKKLEDSFQLVYEVSVENLLKTQDFNVQDIFDEIVDKLHVKLSSNYLKKYPSLVEVYCSTIEDVKNYKVKVNPSRTFPVTLLLMEDYVPANKLKGLRCCKSILLTLSPEDFKLGNYYEIIYGSLKKAFLERDLKVTKLCCECLLHLLKLLPSDVRLNLSDQLHSEALDQLFIETNLFRKTELFNFITKLFQILNVECVKKKKKFSQLMYDNLESCCTEGVADILLLPIIECYEQWLIRCWCVWTLNRDHKILNVLFKLLYMCKDDNHTENVINLLVTLISLCKSEERIQVLKSLVRSSEIKCEKFNQNLDLIKKYFE